LTFAEAVEQISVGDCGHSRQPTGDRDRLTAERLHPKVENSRIRPIAAGGTVEMLAAKLP
jgi:hypothetical protein